MSERGAPESAETLRGGSAATPTTQVTRAAHRRSVERWFVARGVPQLIEGYSSEQAMDARATPFIGLWLVVGTIAFWGTRPDWSPTLNTLGVAATLAWMVVVWAAVARLRRRPATLRPRTFDLPDIAVLALMPALPAAVIAGTPREALTAVLGALSGIGVVYVVVGFGLAEIGRWAAGRLGQELAGVARLLAGTLPLLLILVVFLLFAAELWEAAHELRGVELAAVLALLFAVASLLIVATFSAELGRLEDRMDWHVILSEAAGTPAAGLIHAVHDRDRGTAPLSAFERMNLVFLALFNQLLPAAFVAVTVAAALVIFGLLVLPGALLESWIGAPVRVVAEFHVLGESRTLSAELLTVSGLLSGIVGLYFTGLEVTDPTYRGEHLGRTVSEVGRLLAARAVYRAAGPAAEEPAADEPRPDERGSNGRPAGAPHPPEAAFSSSARSRRPVSRSNRGS